MVTVGRLMRIGEEPDGALSRLVRASFASLWSLNFILCAFKDLSLILSN